MQQNATMQGDADNRSMALASLLPMAAVAVIVLVVALIVSGSETGTIVVERTMMTAASVEGDRVQHAPPTTITEITESSAGGTYQRSFKAESISRRGFQQLDVADRLELYDPLDNTIFETTQAAWERAVTDSIVGRGGPGQGEGHVQYSSSTFFVSSAEAFTPGKRSVPAQQLLAHQYTLVGRTTLAGHPALKLVQSRPTEFAAFDHSPRYTSVSTEYVSPRTFDPIADFTRMRLPNVKSTVVQRWRTYLVLPASRANQWRVSLTARHPHARVVVSARGYIRASQDEIRTASHRVNAD
jgi:hypothetical protein